MLRGRRATRIRFLTWQSVAVGEVNVEPAILVIIEKCQPTSLRFKDVFLVLTPPHTLIVLRPASFATSTKTTGDGARMSVRSPIELWAFLSIAKEAWSAPQLNVIPEVLR